MVVRRKKIKDFSAIYLVYKIQSVPEGALFVFIWILNIERLQYNTAFMFLLENRKGAKFLIFMYGCKTQENQKFSVKI